MAQAFLSSGFVGGRPARLGSETFTANGTYNANNFNNAKGQPLDGFSQVTVNTPYEAILDGSVETIDTSVTTLRASAFASMTNLTKLVLRNASSLLSTIQNALPTDLSQGAELNIYVPSSSLDDYAALYGSVYTVNDISLYGRYWFTPVTTETTLTSDMYVSGITAYLTSSDPYDGLSIPSTITALGSGSLTPITSPTSTLGIYDLRFEGDITAFATTQLTSIDSNFSDFACPVTKFRYNGASVLKETFFSGTKFKEIYLGSATKLVTMSSLTSLQYFSGPNITGVLSESGSKFTGDTALVKLNLPKIQTIGANFCDGCASLKTISLPALTTITNAFNTFSNCTSLVSADLPLVTDGARFNGDASLVSVNEPLALTTGSFDGCSALTSVNLQSATTANENAFKSCSSLKSVSLPELKTANASSFQNNGIAILSLPKLETASGSYCFASSSLLELDLPSATSLGNWIFGYNAKAPIKKFRLLGSAVPSLGGQLDGASYSYPANVKIYFLYSNLPAAWVATNWANYTAKFVGVLTYESGSLDTTLAISGTTYNVTWYSDEDLTTVFSGTPVVGTNYYAKLSA